MVPWAQCSCEWLIQQPVCCCVLFHSPPFYPTHFPGWPWLQPPPLTALLVPPSLPSDFTQSSSVSQYQTHSGFTSFSLKPYKVIASIPSHISPSVGTALSTHSQVSWPFTFSNSGCWVLHSTSCTIESPSQFSCSMKSVKTELVNNGPLLLGELQK